ncbi:MAG: hypothetical protein IT531_00340 [Burkholderiales bacterium]|nr:hypothetical protein [Burkholderiales bacterium]
MAQRAQVHRLESAELFPEFAYEHGWTDGLPIFAPTRALVERMIEHVGREPDEVIGAVFPGDGIATIENVAANCAMAGCRPEYVPIVISAVECIVDPALPITTTQSTGAAAILTIVSGPVVEGLGFHTREWLFGPNGGRANATIGRAIRLVLWNIGRAHPGKLVKGTMGHPAAWSYCIGEERALTPWAPMHADLGIAADDSAVTVMKAGDHSQIAVPLNLVGLNECVTLLARAIGKLGIGTGGGKRAYMFVINPALARAFAKAGYTRSALKAAIAERAFKYSYDWEYDKNLGHTEPCDDHNLKSKSERAVFVTSIEPDEIHIVVGGGEAPQLGQCLAISSRSSAGEPLIARRIGLPR